MEIKTKILVGVLIVLVCEYSFAQDKTGMDAMNSVAKGIASDLDKRDELHRVMDDQDKKSHPVRKLFNDNFDEAQSAILANRIDDAKKPIAKLHKISNLNKFESARLFLIDYWYQGRLGDTAKENEAAMGLMPIGADAIEADAYVEAGMRLLKRQYNAKDYGGAIATLGYLRKVPESAAQLQTIATAVAKLDELETNNQNVAVQVVADAKGVWGARLMRQSFYLDKINGTVSSIEFSCDNKTTTLPYTVDSVMAPPAAWGACVIKINSTPNATYNFVQTIVNPQAK